MIGVRWIYKTKYNDDGKVEKYKEILVDKGFTQQLSIDYNEIFTLVARLDTIRIVLSASSQNNCNVYQMEIKSGFLNGILGEEVYIKNHSIMKVWEKNIRYTN